MLNLKLLVEKKIFTPKITKKKKGEKKLKSNDDIVKKLKDLNDLYKSGVLSKEEFKKAKKKILN